MKTLLTAAGLGLALIFGTAQAAQDDAKETFEEVIKLLENDDIVGALEEARFGVQQLEAASQDLETVHFLDEILGYKGGELDKGNAMGMRMTARTYTKGDRSVKVTRMSSANKNAMAGLGMLAQMGAMGGGRPVRIDRRKGTLMEDSGNNTLYINMNSGGTLTFESRDLSGDEIVTFAEAFPVAEMDEAGS